MFSDHPDEEPPKTSSFVGVHYDRTSRRWKAKCALGGKVTYLGSHDTEEAAARAYDTYAAQHGKLVNFPLEHGQRTAAEARGCPTSRFIGVYYDRESRKFVARCRLNRRKVYLGHHTTEKSAARAYDAFAGEHGKPLNFPAGTVDTASDDEEENHAPPPAKRRKAAVDAVAQLWRSSNLSGRAEERSGGALALDVGATRGAGVAARGPLGDREGYATPALSVEGRERGSAELEAAVALGKEPPAHSSAAVGLLLLLGASSAALTSEIEVEARAPQQEVESCAVEHGGASGAAPVRLSGSVMPAPTAAT